jgi:hypothetical protein
VGLVLMALNPRNRFEASVFRRFRDYHRFIERLVEAPSINRFAPNVRQRTLPGVFHAVVLNWARQQPWGQKIGSAAYTLSHALNQPAAAEALTAMVIEALGYRRALELGVFNPQEVEEARAQGQHETSTLVALFRSVQSKYASEAIGAAIQGMYRHGPMRSLRDVEHQVAILPATLLDEEVFAGLTGMTR